MDFISGDLDRMFTVLYEMGRIEPLLKKDWQELLKKQEGRWTEISSAMKTLNTLTNLRDMRQFFESLPDPVIDAVAIEVAKELAEFQGRDSMIH